MEVKKIQVFIVRENSPAFNAIKRYFCKRQFKEGKVLPVNVDEFESFQRDFIQLEIRKGNVG
jgi:hypothetical protein